MTSTRYPSPRTVLTDPFHFVAFGFGSGLMPYAPGTAGTFAGIPIFVVMQGLPTSVYVGTACAMLLVGMWICGRASNTLGVHDHSGIVWDEIVGFLFAMLACPPGWRWIAAGAVLFRVFDIIKPWPVSLVDRRVGGGVGIMLDDLVAGAYCWVAMYGLAMLI
ncbi:MAG: phosphatidylglycerophosphatase A [Pseudomonadota bacterium]|nr:phosphatidylglycerophosphatase A [Pseudomonadota bacterium]